MQLLSHDFLPAVLDHGGAGRVTVVLLSHDAVGIGVDQAGVGDGCQVVLGVLHAGIYNIQGERGKPMSSGPGLGNFS